jgi:hypothetical protein
MTTKQSQLLRMAVRLYSNPNAPKHINRHNQRAWLKSIQFLGDKWLLAKKVERVQ